MGGLLTLGSFLKTFPEIDIQGAPLERQNHVSTIQGISVASYTAGCFVGALTTIFIGDWLGRRKAIFLGTLILVIGATLQCSAVNLPHLIVGRIITGLGNGINTSTVPTWQSETSKSHRRGQLVMIEGALISGGICLSYWVDFGFSFLEPSTISWRFPIGFQLIFCLTILALILELPESPRWLILKGREDEAIRVLAALNDRGSDDPIIHAEFLEIKETVVEMAKGKFSDLFTTDKEGNRHLHRTVLAYVNQAFQQLSGCNLITYYATNIFEDQIGLSGFLSRILAACNGTEYFLSSFIPVFTIERIGRRTLMLIGAAGMSLSMTGLAIAGSFVDSTSAGIASAVFLFVFNTFFAIGWLGMTWLYPAEIVPLRIRAPANAFATSSNWAFNFLVVMITPVCFSSIGYQTYIIFAVINACIVPIVYFFYPETAYRSLEEMDFIFKKTNREAGGSFWKPLFNVVKIARTEPRRYGKNGEALIRHEESDEQLRVERSRSTVADSIDEAEKREKARIVEDRERRDPGYRAENGTAS
ncbi:hypothetical protein FKW77_002016 [Venturia effusa]|uniref:Major facilitator superfamily (MFS) profile domain-containing protein n=1 Tax=Venturia effusa TaxID=50376 RepID=A0A517L8Q3_9PEZI|nr:hypothetical protein FKW77_002016 [Venturia effusa]